MLLTEYFTWGIYNEAGVVHNQVKDLMGFVTIMDSVILTTHHVKCDIVSWVLPTIYISNTHIQLLVTGYSR